MRSLAGYDDIIFMFVSFVFRSCHRRNGNRCYRKNSDENDDQHRNHHHQAGNVVEESPLTKGLTCGFPATPVCFANSP